MAKRKPRPRLHNGDAPTYEFRLTEEELNCTVSLLSHILAGDWEAAEGFMGGSYNNNRDRVMNAGVYLRNRLEGRK